MDNCSQNGAKLRESVLTMAEEWKKAGYVDEGFVSYVSDEDTEMCIRDRCVCMKVSPLNERTLLKMPHLLYCFYGKFTILHKKVNDSSMKS